jgi:hypothetical protein
MWAECMSYKKIAAELSLRHRRHFSVSLVFQCYKHNIDCLFENKKNN